MIGIDTSFLVAFENSSHEKHVPARELARAHSGEGFALAPQVLTELVHIVTDPRRFASPVSMEDALETATKWWSGREISRVYPDDRATTTFLDWIARFRLGRKRLLDTMLAATYSSAGVSLIDAFLSWKITRFSCTLFSCKHIR